MYKFFLITYFISGYFSGYSQNNVEGRVLKSEDIPIEGADVLLEGTQIGDATSVSTNPIALQFLISSKNQIPILL